MSELSVSIVIPVWGPSEITDACLAALNWTATDYKLILCDNTGKYEVPLGTKNLDALFRNPENLGCTGAKIQGCKAAKTDIIVMMDCDTEPKLDWLADLMVVFDDQQVAMAGPKLVYPDGRIQCACIRTWHGNGSAGGENRQDDHPSNSDEDGCTGACMAIRRSVLEAVGGIDPLFKNGYDDVDLDLAVKEAGWKIAYVAESVVTHRESSTGPERWTYAHENVAYMNAKWGFR